jgi:uncharacterized iron-regulated protein
MRPPSTLAASSLLFLAACTIRGSAGDAASGRGVAARPLPPLERAVRAYDSRAGAELALDALLDRLADHDVVFVGETHLDDVTHRVEAEILAGLSARRAGKVVLALEMFERDVQPALDAYLAGELDEEAFLAAARPWGNYRADYRPLVELARTHSLPVIAANAPAALRRKVSAGGRAALDALAPEERRLFPAEILPASDAYWERVDRATRGHMDFASQPEEQRLFSGQNLWDNSMGAACAEALAAHPGATVVHVVGGFHVAHGDGTVAQLRARAPDARVAVVEVVPALALHAARPERDASSADYLVYSAALARSASEGAFAVLAPGEVRWTLDVPPGARADEDGARVPLVVWLPDGDERPEDARALLTAALGDEVAVAVLEPPYPERAADLAPGGRWARAGLFAADQGRNLHALEQLVEYATRRFPITSERVVVAGRGAGATAVLASAFGTEWLAARFLALAPRGAGALRLEGLPERASVARAVEIRVAPEALEDSAWLADDFRTLGTPVELVALDPAVPPARALEDALRTALELAPRASLDGEPVLCVLERELPRARQWAEAYARRLERDGSPAQVVTHAELTGEEDPARLRHLAVGGHWPLASFAAGAGIPLAEGAFGGTTVLVVPASADAAERDAWLALERERALKQRSPFAGLRVALADAEPSLAQVIRELHGAGARSVLVVPATFCASRAEMRALEDALGESAPLADELELTWLPGLGAELCRGTASE